jgi:hypothetical protein
MITPSQRLELDKAIARSKSYTGAAILTLFLYCLIWIPGLIANILYLIEAHRMENLARRSLPGVGCLWILLVMNLVAPIFVCVISFFVLIVVNALGSF